MRIATSTIYDNQIATIDTLVAQQELYGTEASTGKQLLAPSDDPTEIAQDLALHTTIAQENQSTTNFQNAAAQLTTEDGALSSLTQIMQSARSLAVQAGGGIMNQAQLSGLATQVESLLQEAVGVANTQYAGSYIFAGTAAGSDAPVTANGSPISSVTFSGNSTPAAMKTANGETIPLGVTLQQAFNYNAPDGSSDVFQTLIDLRNTLTSGQIVSKSATGVNAPNQAMNAGTAINGAGVLATPLAADSNGNVDVKITSKQAPNGVTIAIAANLTVAQTVAAINAQTAATGVTASFDFKAQRLTLTSASGSFEVQDAASPGAATPGNFVEAFGLQSTADLVNDVSRQLGDIDTVMQSLLNARATLGGTIQTLTNLNNSTSSQAVNDTKVQSNIEDADIAKVATQLTQTQTALQAAYATTTRLESKTLMDYLQ